MRNAGIEPGTTASVVWSDTNEPPHLLYQWATTSPVPMSHHISTLFLVLLRKGCLRVRCCQLLLWLFFTGTYSYSDQFVSTINWCTVKPGKKSLSTEVNYGIFVFKESNKMFPWIKLWHNLPLWEAQTGWQNNDNSSTTAGNREVAEQWQQQQYNSK